MFGSKEVKDAWYSIAGFGLLFEVNDDPDDNSEYRDRVKSLAVWLMPWESGDDSQIQAMPLPDLMKREPLFVGSITKHTTEEFRRWSISTLKSGWVTVIVTPTIEWEPYYIHRVYPAIKIMAGFRGNFVVSLPTRRSPTSPGGTDSDGRRQRPALRL